MLDDILLVETDGGSAGIKVGSGGDITGCGAASNGKLCGSSDVILAVDEIVPWNMSFGFPVLVGLKSSVYASIAPAWIFPATFWGGHAPIQYEPVVPPRIYKVY